MTGKPVLAASARAKVLFPDPASPVTMTRRPTRVSAASLIKASVPQVPVDHIARAVQPAVGDARGRSRRRCLGTCSLPGVREPVGGLDDGGGHLVASGV